MENPSLNTFRERLYMENYIYIHDLAKSRLLDKSLVDTVIQETFRRAFRQLPELEKDPKPLRRLFRTALNIIGLYNEGGTPDA
jgi:DNA-directed RNA polymerase specialized sigma24 family protein